MSRNAVTAIGCARSNRRKAVAACFAFCLSSFAPAAFAGDVVGASLLRVWLLILIALGLIGGVYSWRRYTLSCTEKNINFNRCLDAAAAQLDTHIRRIIDSTDDGIYSVDKYGCCTFINRAGAALLGYVPNELVGQPVHELIHRSTEAKAADDCSVCTHQHSGSDIRNEMIFWHRSGYAVPVEGRIVPIREQDKVAGAVVWFTSTAGRSKAGDARLYQLAQAVEQSPSAVVITDLLGNIEYINSSFMRRTGYTAAEMLGKNRMLLQNKTAEPAHFAELWKALETRGEWCGEVCSRRKDGTHYWVRESISILRDDKGQACCYLVIEEDISRAYAAEKALIKSQHRLEEAQRIASMGNWELDLATGEIWWSEELHRIFGMPSGVRPTYELCVQYLHPEDRTRVECAIETANRGGQPYNIEYRIIRPDGMERVVHAVGETVYDQEGLAVLMRGTAQDITERKSTEQRLHHLAYYDDLTCLPNRTLFMDRLERAALEAKRHGRLLGLLCMDLDRLKQVNETIGHEAGDALIKSVAQRLLRCVREVDTVARMGGDDFAILLSELRDGQEAAMVARKVLDSLQQPFLIRDQELTMTAGIGVSIYPNDTDDIKTLLKNADAAMDYAKEHGRNNYQFYSVHMTAAVFERLMLESNLRKALERNEFELHYQPQINLASGCMIGCEALLRWRHSELGLVSPMRFIPLAEDTGLIIPITEWVLRTACEQARRWREAGLPAMRMAVNISSRHFREPGLVEMIEQVLLESGMPPDYLELELTESVIMEHTDAAVRTIGRLWALGVQLAMDDFGTGYSSLGYLKRFPMQVLKIDRSFIGDLTTDPADAALVRAIILMAHSLEMQVVAEGVETAQQLDFLRAEGCDFMQGYYFSPPCPSAEFEQLLRSGRTL